MGEGGTPMRDCGTELQLFLAFLILVVPFFSSHIISLTFSACEISLSISCLFPEINELK